MTEKRFELSMSGNEVAQYEIIDHSQEILTVYNNLGNVYFSSAMKICELLNNLADENEQLKSTMKEVAELLEEEVDVFTDKAIEHDINAYIELKELDNKDAYYLATATKKAIKMLKELEE